jgi:hypothetical protein
MIMVSNYVQGGDVIPETELVVFFVRPGGTIARPVIAREPVKDREGRNVVSDERRVERAGAYKHRYADAGAHVQVRFRASKRARWDGPQRPASLRGMAPEQYGVTWEHAPRAQRL